LPASDTRRRIEGEHRRKWRFPTQPEGASTGMNESYRQMLDSLPVAVCATDASGKIIYFNEAAVDLWGTRPELGISEWCGSWKLYRPDGTPLPHGECPMAMAIKERRAIRDIEAIAERPDGSRVLFMPFATPLFDASGTLTGAVNMLVDMTDRERAEEIAERLAAIVASSDDAIISKDLHGVIVSWNTGAEKLFGYAANEVIGKPITILIPADRQDEEVTILSRVRRGERIEHYETIRQRKDGSLVDISLTVSPVKDGRGRVIGASKIARDITERRRAADLQDLALGEMKHRVKNLNAVIEAVGRQSLPKNEPAAEQFWVVFIGRIRALLSVGEIIFDSSSRQADFRRIAEITLQPFLTPNAGFNVETSGPALLLSEQTAGRMALALHELATNALKYGALKTPEGSVRLFWSIDRRDGAARVRIEWKEQVPHPIAEPNSSGFGARVIAAAVSAEPNGKTDLLYEPDGLRCRFEFESP
jgi:two-component system, chemotaxis family, CheB/CheR fusion protein